MFKMKNENSKKYGSSHADIFAEIFAEVFAGNGKNIHAEGLASECSFCKPCGIAVEFDNVVYITDIDTNRVNVITPLIITAELLKYVFSLYKDNAINLKDMPLFEKKTIKKLEYSKIEVVRNWATVNGKAVRQWSNRQQTTMAVAGTLPMSVYELRKQTI